VLPDDSLALGRWFPAMAHSNLIAVATFGLLAAAMYYFARKPLEGGKKD